MAKIKVFTAEDFQSIANEAIRDLQNNIIEEAKPEYDMIKATASKFVEKYRIYKTNDYLSQTEKKKRTSYIISLDSASQGVLKEYDTDVYQKYLRQALDRSNAMNKDNLHALGLQLLEQVRQLQNTTVRSVIVSWDKEFTMTFTFPPIDPKTNIEKIAGSIQPDLRMSVGKNQSNRSTTAIMTAKQNAYIQAFKTIYEATQDQDLGKQKYYYYNVGDVKYHFSNYGDLKEALVQLLMDKKSYSDGDAVTALLYYAQQVDWRSGLFTGDVAINDNQSLQVKGDDAHTMGMSQLYGLALNVMLSKSEEELRERLSKIMQADPARTHIPEHLAKKGNEFFEQNVLPQYLGE